MPRAAVRATFLVLAVVTTAPIFAGVVTVATMIDCEMNDCCKRVACGFGPPLAVAIARVGLHWQFWAAVAVGWCAALYARSRVNKMLGAMSAAVVKHGISKT